MVDSKERTTTSASTRARQKHLWLQGREERRQAQLVTTRQGWNRTPSLYFSTRRCTYSTVVSMVTTALPLHHRNESFNSCTKETCCPTSPDNQNNHSEARSPYAKTTTLATHQQQTSALIREQRAFTKSLQQLRRARARREHDAAMAIQRIRRGFVLRRRFCGIREQLLARKRIGSRLLHVAQGTTTAVLGENDQRLQLRAKQSNAVAHIQGIYRMRAARRVLIELRALHRRELQRKSATQIQSLFLGYQARARVRAIRSCRESEAVSKLQNVVRCRLLASKERRQTQARNTKERSNIQIQSFAQKVQQHAFDMALRRTQELVTSTLLIQRVVRGFLARRRVQRCRLDQVNADCATHVTRIVRGFLGRVKASRERAIAQRGESEEAITNDEARRDHDE